MKNEFYEAYGQLFENSYNMLRRTIRIKLKAIRYTNRILSKVPKIMHTNTPLSQLTKGDGNLLDQIQAEKQTGFPADFVFKPIQQREVDEESSMFYSSSPEESSDSEVSQESKYPRSHTDDGANSHLPRVAGTDQKDQSQAGKTETGA